MKKCFFYVLLLTAFACNKTEYSLDGFGVYSRTYIREYFMLDSIGMSQYGTSELNFAISLQGKCIEYDSAGFDSLSKVYNDLSYNKVYYPFDKQALANRFSQISIYSDSDFDEQHPAGTVLDDIVYFHGFSFYPIIQSNYTEPDNLEIRKPLNQLTKEEMILLFIRIDSRLHQSGHLSSFSFSVKPTKSMTHTFTLTVTDESGKEYKTTQKYVFE